MTSEITVHQAYQQALKELSAVCDTPALDAQMLLADALDRSRAWILAHPEQELDPHAENHFFRSLSRRESGESLPYILGWWEFYGRRFHINNSVLIPRPETEHIVETAIGYLRSRPVTRKALDVGTGSGCIAISIALEVDDLHVVASDISWEALEIASANASRYQVGSRIHYVQMDLDLGLKGAFDIICANLPYIPTSTLQGLDVARHEPQIALNGGSDGFELIRPILKSLPSLLLPGGCALFELEAGSGEKVLQIAKTYVQGARLKLLQDLAGHDRVLIIQT